MSATYRYHNPSTIAKCLTVLLGLGAAAALLAMGSHFMQLELLARPSFGFLEGMINEWREKQVFRLQMGLFFITMVFFSVWIFRANNNVRARGAKDLPDSPGWALGWFFVPVFNLWRPYLAMKHLWQASVSPQAWQGQAITNLLRIWWGLWLVTFIVKRVIVFRFRHAHTHEVFVQITYTQITHQALILALCISAIMVVRQITRAQQQLGASHFPAA